MLLLGDFTFYRMLCYIILKSLYYFTFDIFTTCRPLHEFTLTIFCSQNEDTESCKLTRTVTGMPRDWITQYAKAHCIVYAVGYIMNGEERQ